jgi:hypothetical protein
LGVTVSVTPDVSAQQQRAWVGTVESRLRKLAGRLSSVPALRRVRLMPAKFDEDALSTTWSVGYDYCHSPNARGQATKSLWRPDALESDVPASSDTVRLAIDDAVSSFVQTDCYAVAAAAHHGTCGPDNAMSTRCRVEVSSVSPCDALPDCELQHVGGRAGAKAAWTQYTSAKQQEFLSVDAVLQLQVAKLLPSKELLESSCKSARTCRVGGPPRETTAPLAPLVVIDGMNVARHGHEAFNEGERRQPVGGEPPQGSARAILRAASWCLSIGFRVDVILPEWALYGRAGFRGRLAESELLEPLMLNKQLHLSPARFDDDQFILNAAQNERASSVAVLSNDLYRDHCESGRVEKQWLQSRLLGFLFTADEIVVVPRRPASPKAMLGAAARCLPSSRPLCAQRRTALPSVVVDGLDVARSRSFNAASDAHRGSARAIVRAIEWFRARGFVDIAVILPQWAVEPPRDHTVAEPKTIFDRELLSTCPHIALSPSGYDCDEFIRKVALQQGSVVVSNDGRLLNVPQCAATTSWLVQHRIQFRFDEREFHAFDQHGRLLPVAQKRRTSRTCEPDAKRLRCALSELNRRHA